MVLGTPTTPMPSSVRRLATPRVSSPPMATRASTPLSASTLRMRSTPPSTLNGLVRDEPRIVPPRARMSSTSSSPIGRVSPSSGPCHPFWKPSTSQPCASIPLRVTARITAFRPGQSPPPVSTPIRMSSLLIRPARRRHHVGTAEGVMNWIGAATLATTRVRAHGLDHPAWSRSRGREAESAALRLDHLPADEVVPRVGERVVRVRRGLRQPRPTHVLPALPQVPGEPGQRPWQRRHRAPQLGQRDMVVRGDPRPQLQLTPVGLVHPEKGHQVLPDPGPRPPCRITRGWQFRQHVLPHPRAGPGRVELGGHGVELAALLVDDTDRHEIDRDAVLDELAVVEVPHAPTLSVAADQPALVS